MVDKFWSLTLPTIGTKLTSIYKFESETNPPHCSHIKLFLFARTHQKRVIHFLVKHWMFEGAKYRHIECWHSWTSHSIILIIDLLSACYKTICDLEFSRIVISYIDVIWFVIYERTQPTSIHIHNMCVSLFNGRFPLGAIWSFWGRWEALPYVKCTLSDSRYGISNRCCHCRVEIAYCEASWIVYSIR